MSNILLLEMLYKNSFKSYLKGSCGINKDIDLLFYIEIFILILLVYY